MAFSRHGCGAFENRCWKEFYKNGGVGECYLLYIFEVNLLFFNDLFKCSDDGT